MLVKFSSTATESITMFGDPASQLIKMLGASGKVPGAISADDIPAALERLQRQLQIHTDEPEGQSAEAIIQRMRATLAVYPLSASELAKLRAQGVPDAVIDYMQETYVEAVRQQEWARARGGYYGYSAYPWYRPYCWSPYCR